MDMEKSIPHKYIIQYIFAVAFVFVGIYSMKSKAARDVLAAQTSMEEPTIAKR